MANIKSLIVKSKKNLQKAIGDMTEVLITLENYGAFNDELQNIHGKLIIASKSLDKWIEKHRI